MNWNFLNENHETTSVAIEIIQSLTHRKKKKTVCFTAARFNYSINCKYLRLDDRSSDFDKHSSLLLSLEKNRSLRRGEPRISSLSFSLGVPGKEREVEKAFLLSELPERVKICFHTHTHTHIEKVLLDIQRMANNRKLAFSHVTICRLVSYAHCSAHRKFRLHRLINSPTVYKPLQLLVLSSS